MGTVLESTICHYCGDKATTQDHIVAKSLLPHGIHQPAWFRALNIVPACSPCNNRKGWLSSDCMCGQCKAAWANALRLFPYVAKPHTVHIVRSPG